MIQDSKIRDGEEIRGGEERGEGGVNEGSLGEKACAMWVPSCWTGVL